MLRNNFMSHFLFSHITCLRHFSKSGEHVTSIGISAFKSPFKFQIILFLRTQQYALLCYKGASMQFFINFFSSDVNREFVERIKNIRRERNSD